MGQDHTVQSRYPLGKQGFCRIIRCSLRTIAAAVHKIRSAVALKQDTLSLPYVQHRQSAFIQKRFDPGNEHCHAQPQHHAAGKYRRMLFLHAKEYSDQHITEY